MKLSQLDDWQVEILKTEGNICLRSGRQVGKSTVIAVKAGEYAVTKPKSSIMIISATERQAYLLFSKVLLYISDVYPQFIKKGRERPTKKEIKLLNGSIIRCLPTGADGLGIRGYTNNLLIADEAAFIPEEVWAAVTPSLSTTGGQIILLSTPFGRKGYFYNCFNDPFFTKFHISTREVAEKRQEPQRTFMLNNLEAEKSRMTKLQFIQEYEGEFIDELRQFFPTELINKCCVGRRKEFISDHDYYLGVDVARMGGDECTFEIIDRIEKNKLIHDESIVKKQVYLTEVYNTILELNKIYDFKKIYIDDGGIGVGVFDYLLEHEDTKRKVVAINNRSRPLDDDDKHKKKILKEDLYNNLLGLMERGEIVLLDDDEVKLSFKSIQYEYETKPNAKTLLKIFGSYSHIVEGLHRAAWCYRDKSLNIWIR